MKLRTFWTLIKLSTAYRTRTKRTSRTVCILYLVLGLGALIPFLGFAFSISEALYQLLAPLHAESAEVALSIVCAQLISFVFGMGFVVTSIYLSRDTESFLAYPIAPRTLVGARFTALWSRELVTTAIFTGPTFVVYALHHNTFGTWTAVITMMLLVPVIPLMLAFILVTLFMRVTNIRGLQDKLRYVGGAIGLIIYALFRVAFRGNAGQTFTNATSTVHLLVGPSGYVTRISAVFPPSLWEIRALTETSVSARLSAWGVTLLATIVLSFVSLILAEKLFLAGYLGGFEQTRKRRGSGVVSVSGRSRNTTPFQAILKRDWQIFFRTPTFVMNVFSSVVMGFFVAVFPLLSSNHTYFLRTAEPGLVLLYGAAFIAFIGTASAVSGSSISREGKQFYDLKVMPISPITYVRAKWWFANIYSAVLSVLVGFAELLVVQVPLTYAIFSSVLGFTACTAYNVFAVLVDLNGPNLRWTSEQMVFKGMRTLWLMLGLLLTGGIMAGIDAVLYLVIHAPWMLVSSMDLVLCAAIAALGYSVLHSNARGLYADIE